MRPKLAALVGAASLAVSTSATAASERSRSRAGVPARTRAAPAAEAQRTLGQLIRERLKRAEAGGRRAEIEQLAGLWLTLAQRGQLDRVVCRGEGFINVALRNHRLSHQRSEARARRTLLLDQPCLEAVAGASVDHADERIDVSRFIASLAPRSRDALQAAMMGMNHREVGEATGMSHAAARKWAERLRKRLTAPDAPQVPGLPGLPTDAG